MPRNFYANIGIGFVFPHQPEPDAFFVSSPLPTLRVLAEECEIKERVGNISTKNLLCPQMDEMNDCLSDRLDCFGILVDHNNKKIRIKYVKQQTLHVHSGNCHILLRCRIQSMSVLVKSKSGEQSS